MEKHVAIYTTPGCVYCRHAKDFFNEHGVKYEEYNVVTDLARRQEMVDKSGQRGVPVIMIANTPSAEPEIIVGFDQSALTRALGL